jgi:hypothetical protein
MVIFLDSPFQAVTPTVGFKPVVRRGGRETKT